MGLKNTKPKPGTCAQGHYLKSVTRINDDKGNTLRMCYTCSDGNKWCDSQGEIPATGVTETTMGCNVAMKGLALEDNLNLKAVYCETDNVPSSCGDKCRLLSCDKKYIGGFGTDEMRPANSLYNSYLTPMCYTPPPPIASLPNPDGNTIYPVGTDSTSTGSIATSMQTPILGLPPMLFWFILIVAAAFGGYFMLGSNGSNSYDRQGMQNQQNGQNNQATQMQPM